MTGIPSPLALPLPADSRVPQHRQAHVPQGQLALQQPSLAPPVTARVAAEGQAARDVRDRNRGRRERRRDTDRGGLMDREL